MLRNSIVTNRNLYCAAHRWSYANGWSAAGAFAFVSLLAFPFAFGPSAALSIITVTIGLYACWTEMIEHGLRNLRDMPDPVAEIAPDSEAEEVKEAEPTHRVVKTYDEWDSIELDR